MENKDAGMTAGAFSIISFALMAVFLALAGRAAIIKAENKSKLEDDTMFEASCRQDFASDAAEAVMRGDTVYYYTALEMGMCKDHKKNSVIAEIQKNKDTVHLHLIFSGASLLIGLGLAAASHAAIQKERKIQILTQS